MSRLPQRDAHDERAEEAGSHLPSLEEALERAIALYRLDRHEEARSALESLLGRDPTNATAWTVLGYLQGDLREPAAAAAAFDRALDLRPDDPTALRGRARMALERSEREVLDRYAAALGAAPGDPKLILEQTEARISEGDEKAIDDFARVAAQWPDWTEGQIALGRMLWETRRDQGFADHIARLLASAPRRPDLWRHYIDLLASCDRHAAAADAARDARAAMGDSGGELALLEAVQAGWAGDAARAEALFPLIPPAAPGRAIHESVHFIRKGELGLALASIEAALAEAPFDIDSWAVAELLYRALGDPRSAWLSGQAGLVGTFDLSLDAARFDAIKALLRDLHRSGVQMLGQSVRAGTQTRWRLFDRPEPELAELRRALEAALAEYRAGLPPADERHPLLRHRDAPLTIAGSWSVRLTASGHHISHIHPRGLISSACYFDVPEPVSSADEGCLELGRPPAGLLPGLAPSHVIVPKPGQLTLFPSFLHHGTRPFAAGERLAVAFDVTPRLAARVAVN
jgi:tetratricopeptide (TPR) repeat protein